MSGLNVNQHGILGRHLFGGADCFFCYEMTRPFGILLLKGFVGRVLGRWFVGFCVAWAISWIFNLFEYDMGAT